MTPEPTDRTADLWDAPDAPAEVARARRAVAAWAAGAPAPPAGFADRAVRAAVRDRLTRRRRRGFARLALAAGVFVAAGVILRRPSEPAPEARPVPREMASVVVEPEPSLADARAALANLGAETSRAWEETVGLLPSPELPAPALDLPGAPAVESLKRLPGTARDGVAPVANSARRAWRVFLRDTGLDEAPADGRKMN